MNDQMNQSQGVINPPFLMNNTAQISNQSRLGTTTTMMNPNPNPSRGTAQSRMMIRNYGVWPPPQNPPEPINFQNATKSKKSKPRNWKGKDKRKPPMTAVGVPPLAGGVGCGGYRGGALPGGNTVGGAAVAGVGGYRGGVSGGYKPPSLNELQTQNRIKSRRFNPNKRNNNRFAPYAPRNTTSFLIRAKKSGGIASLISPCPVTPAILPTPIFSPSTETLGDIAKEEWGVDGYGSMKGLIRLRENGGCNEEGQQAQEEIEEEEGSGSSESDVEEHVEVERRLDQDLSRFEMVYPSYNGGDHHNLLENRVDDQDSHIAQLEEENLILKERLFLMDRELGDLRRRLQFLEMRQNPFEEVVDNVSENGSEEEIVEENYEECGENEFVKDVCREEEEASVRSIDDVGDEEAHSQCAFSEQSKDGVADNNIGDQ